MASIFTPIVTITGLTSLWIVYSSICLICNYVKAAKLGLPIRVIPISHTNPVWMLVDRKVISIIKRLPFANNSFTRYNYRGWELPDRYYSHREMGEAFVLVTPGRNWIYVSNPDTLLDVFKRRTDFPRCLELTGMTNVPHARVDY
ncbi:hypothetical protein S40285_09714 [Stachybotrys chlorohalonatus IBT 40285]|uniref:Uncharacterized protein n=1 Tax=Stachybotrys chlorohalonatus (strain IBT 40285) TaxID=1283841 RepID=A0A084QY59_STAC4|nr:hypothetical protein S40285_09714 [Stachybotrys chlorohalonata IBT 40285]